MLSNEHISAKIRENNGIVHIYADGLASEVRDFNTSLLLMVGSIPSIGCSITCGDRDRVELIITRISTTEIEKLINLLDNYPGLCFRDINDQIQKQ